MSILGLFFLIIIIVLVFGLSIISSIVRALFGFGKRRETGNGRTYQQSQTNSHNRQSTVNNPEKKREKFFDDSEGEYVDFEEVKEDKE